MLNITLSENSICLFSFKILKRYLFREFLLSEDLFIYQNMFNSLLACLICFNIYL